MSSPRPIRTEPDKRLSLDEMASLVPDGAVIAVGGGLSSREPMALLRALLRKGVTGLTIVGSAHGIDVDLLCAGGALARCAESYVGFEQDFGLAPNYRRALESGAVEAADSCCYTLVQQLRAAIQGLPFMPIRSVRGTGFIELHPEYKLITCPFTGEELLLVPALEPDVALIHAQYGDQAGNLVIQGPPVADLLFARASKLVLATVEKIVAPQELREISGSVIPYFYVAGISEAQMGAHPTACYPFYGYDRPHTALYHAAAREGVGAFKSRYLDVFVHGTASHDLYLARIGGEATCTRLASWANGDDAWMNLYRDETPA